MSGLDDILREQDEIQGDPPETTETKGEGEGEGESKVADKEESKSDEGTTEDSKTGEEVKDEPAIAPPHEAELNELRQFIREQRKEIAAMKAKLGRVKESGEVDDEGNTKVEYTNLEKLQMELHNVAIAKTPNLEVLVEAMSLSPKYDDIYEVCTKAHFDDIFETAAAHISRQEGIDFNEALVQLELEVWKKPNPYKYMYGIIKENHPKYKGKETTTKETKDTKPVTPPLTAKKALEVKDAPGSIAAAGGGETKGGSGWTSARIDDLDESELHQVPTDIYEKYMMGTLK